MLDFTPIFSNPIPPGFHRPVMGPLGGDFTFFDF